LMWQSPFFVFVMRRAGADHAIIQLPFGLKPRSPRVKLSVKLALLVICGAALLGCVTARLQLPIAKVSTDTVLVSQLHSQPVSAERRKSLLGASIYGAEPGFAAFDVTASTPPVLTLNANVRAFLLTYTLLDQSKRPMSLVIVSPKMPPRAVIVVQSFCGVEGTLAPWRAGPSDVPIEGPCGVRWAQPLLKAVFGAYAGSPPVERLLAAGFAVAIVDQTALMPDQRAAELLLDAMTEPGMPRTGAIRVWARAFGDAGDVISANMGLPAIAFGHSRNGKSALLAGALYPSVSGVIAHQSGTGGTTPLRSVRGEPISAITDSYPHWFTPEFANMSDHLPTDYDQHHLIAALAGKPLLLGNARQDVWSDPQGAFAAVQAANRLVSEPLSTASGMRDFVPGDRVSYWLRSGRHGITTADWVAFERWLDVHF
jgi:hypothetical protein